MIYTIKKKRVRFIYGTAKQTEG